ncbi:hypothetical protein RKE30_07285 [Streptomyces sp. Li-HN-5-11]|uniref:replication initiator n=1 Tax=Streptomyces sp. Li-HN-5-11 TaxID=3075432 RepID=UPI0028AA5B8D|nr:replication initiator [Streptomyces sp. Li-HN-5-11]WNM36445.1 hypothetical protein RKE30_07285 [Streptomyces sp. Li-HN-5-11]
MTTTSVHHESRGWPVRRTHRSSVANSTPSTSRRRPVAPADGPDGRQAPSGPGTRSSPRGHRSQVAVGTAVCGIRHDEQDPALGTPLAADTYDYEAAVLRNAHAGALWRRFSIYLRSIYLRREVAKRAGLTQRAFRHYARVSFAKVAEYQKRGAVHFHAVTRLDGPEGGDTAPPAWRRPSCSLTPSRLLPPPRALLQRLRRSPRVHRGSGLRHGQRLGHGRRAPVRPDPGARRDVNRLVDRPGPPASHDRVMVAVL